MTIIYVILSISGVLLPELSTTLVLIQLHAPTVMHASGSVPMLQTLLDIMDKFSKLAPGVHRDDLDDLSWPGVWSKYYVK